MNEYGVTPAPGDDGASPAPVAALTVRENERALRRTLSWLASGVLLLLLGWIASNDLMSALTGRYWTPLLRMFFNDICLYGVGAPLFLVCVFRVAPEPPPKRALRFDRLLIALLIAAFFVETAATVTNVVMDGFHEALGIRTFDRIQDADTGVPLWGVILFSLVLPPLGEEFLFRRCLLDRLRPYGEKSAAILSAFAFALFHVNVYQFGYVLLLGLLLSYLYLKTGRLRYCVFIHAGVNLLFGVLPVALDRYFNLDVGQLTEILNDGIAAAVGDLYALSASVLNLTYRLLVNGIVIAGLVFFVMRIGRVRWAEGSRHLSGGRVAVRVVSNPFVWSYLIASLWLTAVYLLVTVL